MTIHGYLFVLYVLEICKAQPFCTAFPSQYVQVGANVTISCIIQDYCKGAVIYRDTIHEQRHQRVNGTLMHEARGIMANTTFTCKCPEKPGYLCGFDIYVGHPPEVPQNLTCEQNGEHGNVTCTWETGKETDFWTQPEIGVISASGTRPDVMYSGMTSAMFHPGSESHFLISIRASNVLGQSVVGEMNITLSHIVRPTAPVLAEVECTSRLCHLSITNMGSCLLLEVQHRRDQGHWSKQLFNGSDSNHSWNISISLEPFVLYHFRARLKLRPHLGLWGQWSRFSQRWTQEEAPIRKLDIWYIKEPPRTYVLLWKKWTESEAMGRILGYTVLVENTKTKETMSWNVTNTTFTNFTEQFCSQCFINISAFNSKGYSPPANIAILGEKEQLSQVGSHVDQNVDSIAISWQKCCTADAGTLTSYLVEWSLAGRPSKELHWQRLSRDQLGINITVGPTTMCVTVPLCKGLHAHECYKVTVYALFNDGRWKEEFNISTQAKAPEKGPDIFRIRSLVDNSIMVSWYQVPRSQWRGCLTHYTIYVQGPKGDRKYDVRGPSREFISREFNILGLTVGHQYSVCMTAWTEAGESPLGETRFFTFKHKKEPPPLVFWILVTSFSVVSFCVVLLCLCHAFSLHQRFLICCHLLPDMVPDPANSKWAKECSDLKGEVVWNLYLSDSSVSSEDEPDTVEVQEIPSEVPVGSTSLQQEGEGEEPGMCLTYTPPSTYLKSFSHESDQTQTSQNTVMTVDYISTQGMLSGESDGEEQQEEEDGRFFPSSFFDPCMSIGGKLTLDSVKINCCDFLEEPCLFIGNNDIDDQSRNPKLPTFQTLSY